METNDCLRYFSVLTKVDVGAKVKLRLIAHM